MMRQGSRHTTGGGGRPRRDLPSRPFPAIALDTPREQQQALAAIREWAELLAEDAIAWYLRDKRLKRLGSRYIRGLTILLAVAGTAVPLAGAAAGAPWQSWGYVLLALAAGCKGFDYFFGLSTSWMRDITAAQELRSKLNEFRLEWTMELLRSASQSAASGEGALEPDAVGRRMTLISGLVSAVHHQMVAETAEWVAQFRSSNQHLQEQGPLPSSPSVPSSER